MKNFTKQNFKTNPLWIRLLIMTFMLLLGSSSAWAVGYTKNLNIGYNDGSGDHWTTNINDGGTIALGNLESAPKLIGINAYTTKWQGGNICSGQVSVENTTYNSTSVNWNYNGSSNDQEFWFSINRTLSSTAGEHSITVTVTIKGGTTSSSCTTSYKRTFKITYTIVAPKTYSATIKFKRPAGWSNTPNIHIFNNGCTGSPFVNNKAMTSLGTANDGSVWYKYDYTVTTTCGNATIMFNNGGWNNGQTNENLTITWGEDYCLTGASSTNVTSVDCPVFCIEPQASNFTYTAPSNLVYNGQAKAATVTWKTGTGSGTITKYYKSGSGSYSTTAPTNVGTYTVAVKTAAGGNYCATNDYVEVGSFTITCLQPAASNFTYTAPSNLVYNGSAKAATVTWKSGTGTGTITKYYKSGSGSYNTTVPTNVGTYTVAVKTAAGGNYCATDGYVEVGSFTITCAQPAASNFTYTAPSNLVYNGSAKTATVTWKSGTGTGTITKYYKSDSGSYSTAAPTNVGTYTVAVKTLAGGNYCATEDYVQVGTFTISGKAPVAADFSYTDSKNYTGSALSANVAWKSGTGTGAITTYYKVKGAADNTYTTTVPTAVGTYTVAVTTLAGGNYAAATTKIVLGDFTINEVCEPIAGLYWEITDGKKDIYCPGDEVSVKITYKGSTAKESQWGGEWSGNIGIRDGNNLASGAVYTMTINKPGTVNLTLKGCDGVPATTSTLEFTTHETPATPTIAFTVNPVGQSKETILSIASYSADNNYIVYRSADNAVGNDTEVGTYTAPMSIRHNDTGSYYYYAKATNKSCNELTATSAIVKLDVQEIGAIIAALGDLKVDPQDPVDFVAMYVKNDGKSDFGATSVTGYTWQFSSDGGNSWTDCASTNTVAGVNYALGMSNGSANCNNFRPNKAGTYRCVVKYNTGDTQNSNYLIVTEDGSTAKTFKGVTMTLPVVSVNTGSSSFPINNFGGTPSKNADKMKEKISVDVKIFENINGTTQVVYDRKARMNYRGSSSLNFLKKSYAFCPGDEICGDKKGIDYVKTKKLNMLGIGSAKDKDWVLYAAAADPSLMRNRLMFDTYKEMTDGWGVSSRYVELVVNGEYKGVYVMMDKITVNENRVNVAWKQDASGATTQKGFIVKFDKTDIADRYENTSGDQKTFKSTYSGHDGFTTYDTQIDQRFEIEYPEKEDIEEDDSENGKGPGEWSDVFNTIKEMFNKFEYELAKGNFSEVQKLIDYTSWADWFIITEFGKNIDGYRASNLFVYDEKGSGKIEARPLWDQELSFNNQCPNYYASYGANSENGLMVDKSNDEAYNNDASTPFWFTGRYKGGRGTYNGSDQTFKGLLDDPCFVAEVKARWAKHVGTNGALTSSALTTKMGGYLKDLDKDHTLSSSTITTGTPLDREFNTFWKNKSRSTIDCGTGSKCFGDKTTGYTDQGFHSSKTNLNNWLVGNRRTNLGNIINGWEGTALSISFSVTPAGGVTTPWEPVMVEVINPSGYEYDFEYTTGDLDQVEGVIIQEDNDKYTYRIPRPSAWGFGDGERDGESYGIKATLKVAEGEAQCGNTEGVPTAEATITLQDEANEDCE